MSNPGAWLRSRNRPVAPVRPRSRWRWLLLPLLGAALPAHPQTVPRPEQHIKWRQSAYQVMAWNSARIKTALAAGPDARELQAAASALASVAASGLPASRPAGAAVNAHTQR